MSSIDIHTHINTAGIPGHLAINNVMAGEQAIEAEHVYNSLGIHPWQLKDSSAKELEKIFIKSLDIPQLVAIGEAGLDRAIAVDFKLQMELFSMQADLAAQLGLPLIVHAVRSHADLIQLRKTISNPSVWIVHGFSGNSTTALQLIRHGMMLSFGSALFKPEHQSHETLRAIPLDSLFLETDNSGMHIDQVYNQAALLLNIERDALQQALRKNFKRCFFI